MGLAERMASARRAAEQELCFSWLIAPLTKREKNLTRDEAKQLLPIIQAYAEGKTVQLLGKTKGWYDWPGGDLSFSGHPESYRIKPEPVECWAVIFADASIVSCDDRDEAERRHSECWGGRVIRMREVV